MAGEIFAFSNNCFRKILFDFLQVITSRVGTKTIYRYTVLHSSTYQIYFCILISFMKSTSPQIIIMHWCVPKCSQKTFNHVLLVPEFKSYRSIDLTSHLFNTKSIFITTLNAYLNETLNQVVLLYIGNLWYGWWMDKIFWQR